MGKETVHPGGLSLNTTIHAGGGEIDAGVAGNTDLVGGRLIVDGLGVATNTTIGHSGRMEVLNSGQAHDVTFSGGGATVEFSDPGALTGTITNWHVGDVIDLLRTRVTAVSESGDTVTVTYHNFLQRQGHVYSGGSAARHACRAPPRRSWRNGPDCDDRGLAPCISTTSSSRGEKESPMTTITAPPIQYGRVIGRGDVLVVERQGSGSHSVINSRRPHWTFSRAALPRSHERLRFGRRTR